ncbi:MAG: ankyrin repeat domain-containing protein, partial [Alphaproteobacteria bacterium]
AEQGVFPERSWDQRYTTDAETLLYRFLKLSADKQFEVNQMLDNIFEMSGEHWQLRPNAFSDTKTVSDLLKEQLLFQVRYGRVDDVTVLLKLGANPEVSDVYGRTALYLATDFTSQDEQNMTPEEEAAQAYKKVLALLLAGARPNSANLVEKDGLLCFDDTPLRHSLIKKRIGISVLLVRAGAKFETDQYGDGPVKVAVMYSKPEAIEMLAKFGADLMQQDKNGRTPLECAIMADKPYHVAMLRHYLIHREDTKALFDKTQEEGRRLKALAEKQGEKMIQAWCGTLPLSARPKKKKAGKHPKTLKQKINALSEENKRRLYNFVDIPYFPEENTSKAAASSVTAADEKHFPVKMSLLWHKRQR